MTDETDFIDIEINVFLEAIYLRYNYDFRQYGKTSVKRRLSNALIRFRLDSISQLQEKVLREPDFFTSVLQYMTISTTEMFRDPAYYKTFRLKVVPYLKSYPSLKIWIAGCSTGEEPYSFAILLKEEGLYDRSIIYATDINPLNLEKAKVGYYKAENMRKYSENYLEAGGKKFLSDYYTANFEGILMDPSLRTNIVFADHCLATDEVFSEMHFISCRNVMIYFEPELQNRAIKLFSDSLCHKGFLGIGEKENLRFTKYGPEFESIAQERIYRKRS